MNRLAIVLLFSVAALTTLRHLAPNHLAGPRVWKPAINRSQAEQAARDVLREYNIDPTGWKFGIQSRPVPGLAEYQFRYPKLRLVRHFTPLRFQISAESPSRANWVAIELDANGELLRFQRTGQPSSKEKSGLPDGQLAERELLQYAGERARLFSAAPPARGPDGGVRYVWERDARLGQGVVARVEATIRRGVVASSSYTVELPASETTAMRDMAGKPQFTLLSLLLLIGLATLVTAAWIFFTRMARGFQHIRLGFHFLALFALGTLSGLFNGLALDTFLLDSIGKDTTWITAVLQWTVNAVVFLTIILVLVSAGIALLGDREKPKWLSMHIAASGDLLARPSWRDFLGGLAVGVVGSLAYVIPSALQWTGGRPALMPEPEIFAARIPAFLPFKELFSWETAALLFLWPLLSQRIRNPILLSAAAALPIALLMTGLGAGFPMNPLAGFGASLLYAAALVAAMHLFGALGAFAAPAGTFWALASYSLPPQLGGTQVLFTGLVFAVVAFLLAWRGQAVDEPEALAALGPTDPLTRSERDRLQAELSIARLAQQGMMPEHTPSLPGFSIGALCDPAREVGGDLYDFLPFPDGRWGLAVADVSGKGVAASLYMTMTKGMLAAARADAPDLHTVVNRLNKHLYTAGKRRTFVTMSLAVLDPGSAQIEHIRAGHNPPLLFRAGAARTEFLRPEGMALGITGGPAFARHLAVQRVGLEPGDVLVLYSDGVVEMMDSQRKLYGEDRLQAVVESNSQRSAPQIVEAIRSSVAQFRGAAEPHDDLTLLVLKAGA
jgi:serine phosphatase RsbU (regulator of sigma subunit)